ncbi:MAG TPA: gamma-glutamyl-gamma-aminobutyrate hydrolase family protein [Pirellulales bacterium]|jgi:GMP synthase (glutamine-hydrolysing)|nr:gamma-glutamyl-gamma-aminobutyrate hydrolase family protein [Pirellulales bacterium]
MKPVLALRHVAHEGLGTIEDVLRREQLVFSVVDLFHESLRTFNPEQLAGLIVMGGPMNVDETDRYPFLADEVKWIRQSVDAGLPVLGVCLGSQLLSKALGSRVYPNRVKEIGWYEIGLTDAARSDQLFGDCRPTETVFQWHGDTFDLPDGAVRLAHSEQCENQAFRFGRVAYGLQFHLEVTPEIIASWLGEPGNCGELDGLDYIDPEAIRRQTPDRIGPLKSLGDGILGRFAALCRGVSG